MLSAESIDGNTEEKATSVYMAGLWVRGRGSRLTNSTLLSQCRPLPSPRLVRGHQIFG